MNKLDYNKTINMPFLPNEINVSHCEVRLEGNIDGAVLEVKKKVRFVDDKEDVDVKTNINKNCYREDLTQGAPE